MAMGMSFCVVNILQEGQWSRKYNHFILLNTELDFGFVLSLLSFVVTKGFTPDP